MEQIADHSLQQIALGKGIDAFWLKIIAIVGMTLDHIGTAFGEYLPLWAKCVLHAFGGLTFPIMAFLLCEGYRHTRSLKRYALRLLLFAIITQVPYMWALMSQLNVLFTLLLGLLAITCVERIKSPVLRVLVVAGFTAASVVCDWGLMGVPMVLMYNYIRKTKLKLILPVMIPFLMLGVNSIEVLFSGYLQALPQLLYVIVGCGLTIPLLGCYQGQRGRPTKYLFYIFYPLHIAVLGIVRGLLLGDWGNLL